LAKHLDSASVSRQPQGTQPCGLTKLVERTAAALSVWAEKRFNNGLAFQI
jgi:hypothetical protein